MKKLLSIVAMASVGVAMSAQEPMMHISMVGENGSVASANVRKSVLDFNPANGIYFAGENTDLSYGEEIAPAILEEDFSKFDTGSIEDPDLDTDICFDHDIYNWFNMSEDYTMYPGWGAVCVYPAGGAAYLDAENYEYNQARITTPPMNLSNDGGVATLRFRARTKDGQHTDKLSVMAVETNGGTDAWTMLTMDYLPTVTPEWKEFEVTIPNAGPSTFFSLLADEGKAVYIDDLSVVQYDLYMGVPVVNKHSNYTGESFDISWEALDKAEYYLVNVYKEVNSKKAYLYENHRVDGTSFTVEGIESGEIYYYTVQGVAGEYCSVMSSEIRVYDVAPPFLRDSLGIAQDNTYIADWDPVPSALYYNYVAMSGRVVEEDGETIINEQNFDMLPDPNGVTHPSWDLNNPGNGQTYDDWFVTQDGWHATHFNTAADAVFINAWFTTWWIRDYGVDSPSYLKSPEMDLSNNDGQFNLYVRMAGTRRDLPDGNGQENTQTQCRIELFVFNEETGAFEVVETFDPGMTPNYKDFNYTFTKGGKRSYIKFTGHTGVGYVFFNHIKISQTMPAGTVIMEEFYQQNRILSGTDIKITIPEAQWGKDIYHKVAAGKAEIDQDGYIIGELKDGAYCEPKYVGKALSNPLSVEKIAAANSATAIVCNGELRISNSEGENVTVYDLSGNTVYTNENADQQVTIELPNRGLYIVKVGEKAIKVIR